LGIIGWQELIRYTDKEIEEFIKEAKTAPNDIAIRLEKMRQKRGHSELNLDIAAHSSNQYRLIIRQNKIYKLDFSIILALISPKTNYLFRLRRYNGKSHQHKNLIEQKSFYEYHIHMATERYQDLGMDEDAYAEPSSRFHDLHSALQCLIGDCCLQSANFPLLRGL
jgi:hypothetical protein